MIRARFDTKMSFIRISQPALSWWFYSTWLKIPGWRLTITIDGDSAAYFARVQPAWKMMGLGPCHVTSRVRFLKMKIQHLVPTTKMRQCYAYVRRMERIVYIHPNVRLVKGVKWFELNDVNEQKDIRETPPTASAIYWRLKAQNLMEENGKYEWRTLPLTYRKDNLRWAIKKLQNFLQEMACSSNVRLC